MLLLCFTERPLKEVRKCHWVQGHCSMLNKTSTHQLNPCNSSPSLSFHSKSWPWRAAQLSSKWHLLPCLTWLPAQQNSPGGSCWDQGSPSKRVDLSIPFFLQWSWWGDFLSAPFGFFQFLRQIWGKGPFRNSGCNVPFWCQQKSGLAQRIQC